VALGAGTVGGVGIAVAVAEAVGVCDATAVPVREGVLLGVAVRVG
jgi:hypothetical protein